MLYPIVTVKPDDGSGRPAVYWYRDRYEQNAGMNALAAHADGVFVKGGWIVQGYELVDFQTAVQEAWDAVRAIRHGTSLERFPRNFTGVTRQTETKT